MFKHISKTTLLIIPLIFSLVISACSIQYPANLEQGTESQKVIVLLNNYKEEEVISKDISTNYYKDINDFTAVSLDNDITNYTIDSQYFNAWIWEIFDANNVIMFQGQNNEVAPSILKYSLVDGGSTSLVNLEKDHEAVLKASSEKYIVWMESSSSYWQDGYLHLYNLSNNEDKIIYEFYRDNDSGNVYAPNFDSCVIKDNKIYFDDIVGIDDKGDYQYNIFCYDINQNSINILKNQSQKPIEYNNELCAFEAANDSNGSILKSYSNSEILKFDCHTIFSASNDNLALLDMLNTPETNEIFSNTKTVESYNEKDNFSIESYGIRVIANNQIDYILSTKNGIGQMKCYDKIIVWSNEYADTPLYYNIKLDKLIMLNFLPKASYTAIKNKDTLYYYYYDTTTTHIYLYAIKSNNTDIL